MMVLIYELGGINKHIKNKIMKQTLTIIFTLLTLNIFSQNFVRNSIHCYEGEINGTEIKWNTENLQCHGYKIKIKNKKITITKGLKKQKFNILQKSGFKKEGELITNTWTCYDTRNKTKCFIYYVIPEEDPTNEEIYIEYKKEIFCFRVIEK